MKETKTLKIRSDGRAGCNVKELFLGELNLMDAHVCSLELRIASDELTTVKMELEVGKLDVLAEVLPDQVALIAETIDQVQKPKEPMVVTASNHRTLWYGDPSRPDRCNRQFPADMSRCVFEKGHPGECAFEVRDDPFWGKRSCPSCRWKGSSAALHATTSKTMDGQVFHSGWGCPECGYPMEGP